MVYAISWDGDDNMHIQTDFDESGDMVMANMYTFDEIGGDVATKTRSCLNQDGRLILYRSCQYEDNGKLIESRYYNNDCASRSLGGGAPGVSGDLLKRPIGSSRRGAPIAPRRSEG